MPARRSLFNGTNSFDGDGEGGQPTPAFHGIAGCDAPFRVPFISDKNSIVHFYKKHNSFFNHRDTEFTEEHKDNLRETSAFAPPWFIPSFIILHSNNGNGLTFDHLLKQS